MFDEIDAREYDAVWAEQAEFEMWVEMMEDARRIRVNVELRELAAELEV